MPITETDIKLLKSARMTDAPDGGGRMTGNVVQSGVDNNMFDDVSNLERVYGGVSLRKVFPAVLTNGTDKYLGARVVIDAPTADPYIEATLFAASSVFDVRDAAKQRVEAYLATGAPYLGLLYGPHIVGMMVVSLYQQPSRAVPGVGDVLILKKDLGLVTEVEQFVRITGTSSVDVTFTDGQGDYTRTVVTCNISDPLRADFAGWEATRYDTDLNYAGRSRVFTSVVANAAQYYGIRPLVVAASVGDFSVKADSSYSQLLPSAQIETPVADASASGTALAAVAVGDSFVLTGGYTLTLAQRLFVGMSVARGSLLITRSGGTTPLSDDGAGVLVSGGVPVGAVDYGNGILSLSDAAYALNAEAVTIAYRAAALPSATMHSLGIHVTSAGRSLTYVKTLGPDVAAGTLVVSYMVAGAWYTLRDVGNGQVKGAVSGQGAGNMNYVTGTLTVTLGALPDVGGDIILQWAPKSAALPLGADGLVAGGRLYFEYAHPAGWALRPNGTVTVTWNDGVARTATLTAGASAGDGVVELVPNSGGTLRVSPNAMPAAGTVFGVQVQVGTASYVNVSNVQVGTVGAAIDPGSLVLVGVQFGISYSVSGAGGGLDYRMRSTGLPYVSAPVWSPLTLAGVLGQNVHDDGLGGLYVVLVGGDGQYTRRVAVGTVNYATGAFALTASVALGNTDPGPAVTGIDASGNHIPLSWQQVVLASRNGGLTVAAQARDVRYVSAGGVAQNTTVAPTEYKVEMATAPSAGRLLRNVGFRAGGRVYAQDRVNPALLLHSPNPLTGVGTTAGAVDVVSGRLTVASWQVGGASAVTAFAAGLLSPQEATVDGNAYLSNLVVFRTPAAPLRPGGFSVLGTLANGAAFNLTADATGVIDTASVTGFVNYQTGVCNLAFKEPNPTWAASSHLYTGAWLPSVLGGLPVALSTQGGVRISSLRYNAVTYSYLPLDASILGLDPVRLPSDGRVPVFKPGRVLVIHNTQKLAPQTVTTGQTVNMGRTLLSRIRVFGNDGLEITSGFAKNMDAGTITFTNVAGMSQPVGIEHRIEDESLCADAQITGELRLTRPLTHAYPTVGTYVSSAYVAGTLQASVRDSFGQEAWTAAWSDSRVGNPILAKYDDTASPVVVTNAGAIGERWAVLFTSNTAFNLIGEAVGQIITGNTATPLAPVNPATGVPYFTLQPAGWGLGWAAGNVLRFNTTGANFPLWVARTVRQSPSAPPGTDQITISVRGDVDQ